MQHLLPVLLLALLPLVIHVQAYAGPGAYERIWFYNAYLADIARMQATGANDAQIARGCRAYPQVCTFNQFIRYIDAEPTTNPNRFNILVPDAANPITDVDGVANELLNKEVTGAYRPGLIMDGLSNGSGQIPKLFSKLGKLASESLKYTGDALKLSIRQASAAVYHSRQSASLDAAKPTLAARNPPINLQTFPAPLFEGSSAVGEELDWRGTLRATGDPTLSVPRLKTILYGDYAGVGGIIDPSHKANVDNAREAVSLTSAGCYAV